MSRRKYDDPAYQAECYRLYVVEERTAAEALKILRTDFGTFRRAMILQGVELVRSTGRWSPEKRSGLGQEWARKRAERGTQRKINRDWFAWLYDLHGRPPIKEFSRITGHDAETVRLVLNELGLRNKRVPPGTIDRSQVKQCFYLNCHLPDREFVAIRGPDQKYCSGQCQLADFYETPYIVEMNGWRLNRGYEVKFAQKVEEVGIPWRRFTIHERDGQKDERLVYWNPEKCRWSRYAPDFVITLTSGPMVVETKGYMRPLDVVKIAEWKRQRGTLLVIEKEHLEKMLVLVDQEDIEQFFQKVLSQKP